MTRKQSILLRIQRIPAGKLWVFVVKQAWAALFGGLLLIGIIVTSYIDLPWLARYDWLFVWAILIQIVMLVTKLEKPREVVTIVLFHLVGMGMELFKTSQSIGSWTYPEDNIIRLYTVPLFSGFMYAAVGSYIARAWRVLELRYTDYPRTVWTILLSVVIYGNFFGHHFLVDIRWLLFACLGVMYWKTRVYFRLSKAEHSMPLLVGFGLVAFFIWIAENIGTYTRAWLYAGQGGAWQMVSLQKLGSWLLLMVISFVMIKCMHDWQTNGKKAYSQRKTRKAMK